MRRRLYKIQRSEYRGRVRSGWGFEATVSYGPWRTVSTYPTLSEALATLEGLTCKSTGGEKCNHFRIMLGKDLVHDPILQDHAGYKGWSMEFIYDIISKEIGV